MPSVPFDPFKLLPSNITLKEHLRQFPPCVGTNHFKGNMVWSNFGYIKIRGRWVDPDCEGAVADAYNAYESGDDEAPYLADLQKRPDTGPRIMSLEEQDEFYSQYTEEVSDEGDGEGDPRLYRITPATFARWAVGSGTGERYEEKAFMPAPKLPSPDPRYEAEIIIKPRPQLQYDMETGSVLSGFYETDPHPRVLHTPQGQLFAMFKAASDKSRCQRCQTARCIFLQLSPNSNRSRPSSLQQRPNCQPPAQHCLNSRSL
ncbi:hypothetical protein ONS95_007317 [Cadophora gregata]|uniref:uncharacterized protein n=1 Tax=Cadophora gregata TaxID=51156 RepID=UPI0026DD64CD|nr:uncharacterized protein ONS95_007317 [Cadophora gregata]KAK0100871.1 hypothetical protein ONS95_007317 [Cadophora gregata]